MWWMRFRKTTTTLVRGIRRYALFTREIIYAIHSFLWLANVDNIMPVKLLGSRKVQHFSTGSECETRGGGCTHLSQPSNKDAANHVPRIRRQLAGFLARAPDARAGTRRFPPVAQL